MTRLIKITIAALALAVVAVAGLNATGHWPAGWHNPLTAIAAREPQQPDPATAKPASTPPVVSVVATVSERFVSTLLVTGTVVAREEVLVAPEVDGFRVLELKADVGDRVGAGDVLATLNTEYLATQLAQNTAQTARAEAAIAQAKSAIAQAAATRDQARAELERAKPLRKSGYLSESVFDARDAAARTATAQFAAAGDGLKLAEAELALIAAQRRELTWRRSRTSIVAPEAGLVAERNARVGAVVAASGPAMFRIFKNGTLELDAEVPETELHRLSPGQSATVDGPGSAALDGAVRLVSPEVDRTTRLGRVRIALPDHRAVRAGMFARAAIRTAATTGIAVPQSAVMYDAAAPYVLIVRDGRVRRRAIKLGTSVNGRIEVRDGLVEGELIVARSGTFLRDGDIVQPDTRPRISEVH